MAKSQNQKCKLLYIIQILEKYSDEEHPISTQELIDRLSLYDISAERKSIYDDIAQLTDFGYDIINKKSKQQGGYYIGSRKFELAELKLLVDAVQASKFITLKKSTELISKLEDLAGVHAAKQLQRHVYVTNRIKTVNESIYYNVDYIHRALSENVSIMFRYFEWTIDKQMKFKKEGKRYLISPWALTFSEENYYLIGYDEESESIKHYRVDKMTDMTLTDNRRNGREQFERFDLATYTNKTFGMFGGEEEVVTMKFSNRLVGVVIDRFGKDIDIRKRDENTFSVRIKVAVSNQFFGWIAGIGEEVKISSPEWVRESYCSYLERIIQNNKNQ